MLSKQKHEAVLVARFLRPQNIVDIEDVITVLVVVAIILDTLARLGENSARISRRLVLEVGVTNAVRRRQVGRQCLQRLYNTH